MKRHVAGWFEIPVANMDRAIRFYENVFGYKLERNKMGPLDMAWFPSAEGDDPPGANGSLVYHEEFYKPSTEGTLIYLSSPTGDVANELKKVEENGGKIVVPKTQISEDVGWMGAFIDSEGNRVALHNR